MKEKGGGGGGSVVNILRKIVKQVFREWMIIEYV